MITFTKLGLYGRLGNALFQYALVRAVSLKTGKRLCLPDINQHVDTTAGQKCKLPHFNIKYDPLVGHFQNKLYFDDVKEQLKKDFQLSEDIHREAQTILSNFKDPTSIHVRLGDYREDYRLASGWEEKVVDYINSARKLVGESGEFLVFTGGKRHSDDSSSDFEWCKERITGLNVHFMEGNSEVLDFELIRCCNNNITGWDSSFSWWASYLNDTNGKIICTDKNQIFPWLYAPMTEWIKI